MEQSMFCLTVQLLDHLPCSFYGITLSRSQWREQCRTEAYEQVSPISLATVTHNLDCKRTVTNRRIALADMSSAMRSTLRIPRTNVRLWAHTSNAHFPITFTRHPSDKQVIWMTCLPVCDRLLKSSFTLRHTDKTPLLIHLILFASFRRQNDGTRLLDLALDAHSNALPFGNGM